MPTDALNTSPFYGEAIYSGKERVNSRPPPFRAPPPPGKPEKGIYQKESYLHSSPCFYHKLCAPLLFGIVLLLSASSFPTVYASEILTNKIYNFFIGPVISYIIFGVTLGVIAIYATGAGFTWLCREDGRLCLVFISIMSAILLGIGYFFAHTSLSTYYGDSVEELSYNCVGGGTSGILYDEFVELLAIRETPGCSDLESVELCDGYNVSSYPYVEYLKYIEDNYRCSGYCETIYTESSGTLRKLFKSTHKQGSNRHTSSDPLHLLRRLKAYERRVNIMEGVFADTSVVSIGPNYIYPPTLFCKANYQSSCTAMLVDDLAYNLGRMGDSICIDGICLIVGGIVLTVATLLVTFTPTILDSEQTSLLPADRSFLPADRSCRRRHRKNKTQDGNNLAWGVLRECCCCFP